jgi:cytochrome P450
LARRCCAALRDTDDPTVIAGAVEEPLRYLTIVHFRVILAGHRIGGVVIRASETLSWPTTRPTGTRRPSPIPTG